MSEELELLQGSAQRFAADSGLCSTDDSSWKTITDLGWLMAAAPQSQGGMGLGLTAASVLHNALGSCLNGSAYLPQMLAIGVFSKIAKAGDDITELMNGARRIAVPLQTAAVSIDEEQGAYLIRGEAQAAISADVCSEVLLCTKSLVALLDFEQVGVKCKPTPAWDSSRCFFEVAFTDVSVSKQQILASGDAAQLVCQTLATTRDLAIAADSLGGANALLRKTIEHLQTRTQFGRPIGMFQALKHRCADLKAMLSAAEAVLMESTALVDGNNVEENSKNVGAMTIAVRSASQLATQAYLTTAEEALQLHGGIGMTSEHYCHLFLKRAMLNEHLGSSQEEHFAALASQYLD